MLIDIDELYELASSLRNHGDAEVERLAHLANIAAAELNRHEQEADDRERARRDLGRALETAGDDADDADDDHFFGHLADANGPSPTEASRAYVSAMAVLGGDAAALAVVPHERVSAVMPHERFGRGWPPPSASTEAALHMLRAEGLL